MIKNLPANWGDEGSIPGSERSPGEGNSNPLQYSCLENSMDKEPGGLQSTGLQRVRHHWATHEHLKIMKWQWFSILATSHRLPSSKTDISSHLLCPPLSFQKVCSSKLQTGIQPAEMPRGLSVQWAWLYQRCRAVTQVAPHSCSWAEECGDVLAFGRGDTFS